jgi:glycosyltransferase involved in cell wall biosynthesis
VPAATPTFSIVVAVHDAADVVGDAVASALSQTVPPHEIVVCDDGSTDDLDTALAPYAGRITLLRQPQRGEAAAKNTAARAASGEFVAILDADDTYEPRRLEALGALALAQPELDILTTDAYLEADGRVVRRCYDETWQFEHEDQRTAILDRNFVFGLAAVRRRVLLEAGGFDEGLRWATDWDCWLRLILAGARVGLVDEPLARYRLHPASLTAQRTALYRGRVAVLEKAQRTQQLDPGERAHLRRSLARERGRAALGEAHDALRDRASGVRGGALRATVARGVPRRARIGMLAAAVAPRLAARRLERGGRVGAGGVLLDTGSEASAATPTEAVRP